jgi:hypothetical protein
MAHKRKFDREDSSCEVSALNREACSKIPSLGRSNKEHDIINSVQLLNKENPIIICSKCKRYIPKYALIEHQKRCKDKPVFVKKDQKKHDRLCQFPGCKRKCWPNYYYCIGHHNLITRAAGASGYVDV